MVLLVVDTQKLITNNKLYEFDIFVSNVKEIIHEARANNIEVIYVRHDDGIGNELTKGNDGFEIYEKFQPINNEKIYDKKVNSSFKETGLLEYLISKGEKNVIVVGLQTDYCIDATIKCGFEHGFNIIVPAYANTTVNNKFMSAKQSYQYYNEFMWNGRYAECISLDETIKRMKYGFEKRNQNLKALSMLFEKYNNDDTVGIKCIHTSMEFLDKHGCEVIDAEKVNDIKQIRSVYAANMLNMKIKEYSVWELYFCLEEQVLLDYVVPILSKVIEINPFAVGLYGYGDVLIRFLFINKEFWDNHTDWYCWLCNLVRRAIKSVEDGYIEIPDAYFEKIKKVIGYKL